MNNEKNPADFYVNAIIKDIRTQIADEQTVAYEEDRIERLYTFHDGAVVKYEWQNYTAEKSNEFFNHRFSLVNLPSPNPHQLKTGIIKTIDYAGGERNR